MIKNALAVILKGIGVGVANVIPGVSGGTIALITGIFERMILAIKSFNMKAVRLLASGKWRAFASYTDLWFLLQLGIGMVLAIFTVARVFDFLFVEYPVYIWSFFFGLILVSVYYIGKNIRYLHWGVILSGLAGVAGALSIVLLTPANENDGFLYLLACGALGMCSMILPGLSGSFVLIIMGNYQLVAIDAINELRLEILIPFFLGAALGLLAFANILSWVFKRYRDQTFALLTGFVAGSLALLWPWKEPVMEFFGEKSKVVGYHWFLPQLDRSFWIALCWMILGVALIILMEFGAKTKKPDQTEKG